MHRYHEQTKFFVIHQNELSYHLKEKRCIVLSNKPNLYYFYLSKRTDLPLKRKKMHRFVKQPNFCYLSKRTDLPPEDEKRPSSSVRQLAFFGMPTDFSMKGGDSEIAIKSFAMNE